MTTPTELNVNDSAVAPGFHDGTVRWYLKWQRSSSKQLEAEIARAHSVVCNKPNILSHIQWVITCRPMALHYNSLSSGHAQNLRVRQARLLPA
jgi:hypothetical protein